MKIAEKEFTNDVLPITVYRPLPKRKATKLEEIREEKVDDEKIIAKEKEIEEEMTEKAVEQGFIQEDDTEVLTEETPAEEEA